MAGEIHGIISREQAWSMWRPYGERVMLHNSLDPANITPLEAVHVTLGADEDSQSDIYYSALSGFEAGSEDWFETVGKAVEHGASDELLDYIYKSNEKQNIHVAKIRQRAIETGGDYVKRLRGAARQLSEEGFWNKSQLEQIHQHLVAPDGTPYMQYTPMTQLEFARLIIETDKSAPDILTDVTNFDLGIIGSCIRYDAAAQRTSRHNKPHEWVHGGVVGTEIYDVTRVDGWRRPYATVVGHIAQSPSIEIEAGDDFSNAYNREVNEGWNDLAAQALMRVDRRLGTPLHPTENRFSSWVSDMRGIKKSGPAVFREITAAALVDATPQNPDAKREALVKMHAVADRSFGMPDALTTVFQQRIKLTDIFTKGKQI